MDHFEQELARMLRDSYDLGCDHGRGESSYGERHRRRLYAGVRARQRVRRAWMATGSALTIAALGAVLMTLPNSFAQDSPTTPRPRPATSAPLLPAPATALPASTTEGEPLPYGVVTTAKPTT
ncbi:hypothetical protein OG885_20670 [Streptomyces sp. NBC_00028]|uniref:hypothetical protein n=1 Tax=Streptomyces sp. NBC_00028 TaxID=2975624 RepID=UPI003246D06F